MGVLVSECLRFYMKLNAEFLKEEIRRAYKRFNRTIAQLNNGGATS